MQTVTPVVMYDEPIPDTPDTPTGDTTSRLPGIALISAGVALMIFAMIREARMGRKKKDDADDYAALCPDFIESEE